MEKVFLTVAARDMEQSSGRVEFEDDRVRFHALGSEGKAYSLDLELVQDIDPDACSWESLTRPDRWGRAVLISLAKRFPSSWDALVLDPAPYRQVMERDWAREDEKLGIQEEDEYFAKHADYLPQVTMKTLVKSRQGVEALVINVQHQACSQCKVADDTFAKVAKKLSEAKKGGWSSRLRLAVVDPRRERRLARQLGARCASKPQDCRHYVLGPAGDRGGDEAVAMRGRHKEDVLESELRKTVRKQFVPVTAEAARVGRHNESRGLVVLAPTAPPPIVRAAHRVRLLIDIAVAASEEDAWELGLGSGSLAARVAVWPPGEHDLLMFSSEPEVLEPWLKVRSLAPLADTSAFEDDEPYRDLGLPVARLYLNGSSMDEGARQAVRNLARSLIGRVAFMVRNATSKAHDWRSHGLAGDYFPAFAVGETMAHNASKYAFLGISGGPAGDAFWADRERAEATLAGFVEEALNGDLEPSPMSQAPPTEESQAMPSAVKKLVGRTCRALVEGSETDALVEAYDQWRRDHRWRTRQVDVLAPLLARFDITVYRIDFGYNECPSGGLPTISAGYSGYFWVPRRAKERKKSWQKLKKLDPPFDRVLSFVKKHSSAKVDAEAIALELNATVAALERQEAMQEWTAQWGATVAAAWTLAAALGGLFWWRKAYACSSAAGAAAGVAAPRAGATSSGEPPASDRAPD